MWNDPMEDIDDILDEADRQIDRVGVFIDNKIPYYVVRPR